MNKAFVKESDADEGTPDRPVSRHANFVTARGLAAIEAEVRRLEGLRARGGDKATMAPVLRDLRYWTARQATARLMPEPADTAIVRFGSTVTIRRGNAEPQTFRIVGEDEADPSRGTVSYTSPLAQAVLDAAAGDIVNLSGVDIDLLAIA